MDATETMVDALLDRYERLVESNHEHRTELRSVQDTCDGLRSQLRQAERRLARLEAEATPRVVEP